MVRYKGDNAVVRIILGIQYRIGMITYRDHVIYLEIRYAVIIKLFVLSFISKDLRHKRLCSFQMCVNLGCKSVDREVE